MKRSTKYLALFSTAALAISPAIAQEEQVEPVEEDRTLETVVVRGAFIPEPQRQTSQVASFLSEEDLIRQGDANAALALARVSGLSVVSDKFAYVRGLGDRYSSALLNGSPLPSPEPLRRTVPLDLFPSNILSGAAVQKTYSANYPGEFGGGVIDLRTTRIPAEDFLNIKVGVGYNTETNSEDGIFVRGGSNDWSGYDDGLRDLPDEFQQVIAQGIDLNDPTVSDEFIETLGESFVNSPLSVIQIGDVDPDLSVEADFGRSFDFEGFNLGLVGVVGFDSGWSTERSERNVYRLTSEIAQSEFETLESTYEATVNGLASAAIGWGTNEVQGTFFYVHTTSKEAQIDTGTDFGAGRIETESTGWFERELYFTQLAGEHEFGEFDLNWRGSYSYSGRDAPYERFITRQVLPDGTRQFRADGARNGIDFSELEDENFAFGADGAYTIAIGDTRELVISGGADYSKTERDSKQIRTQFQGGNSLDIETRELRPDFLFSPDNIDPSRFVVAILGDPLDSDFYVGELEITSAFAQGQIDITDFINATVGARFEDAEQSIVTQDRFGNQGFSTLLANDYLLPSATITWNFADDLQLRAGYSETISRPQFRELAPAIFTDPATDRDYRGNPGLQDTEFTNYDIRLEYYLGRNQFVTLAGFYKEIENPIEEFSYFAAGASNLESGFINAPQADLYGGEFEFRTRFEMPIDQVWFNDRDWLFSVNYTYTTTEISASSADLVALPFFPFTLTSADQFGLDGAELQGTPENILNLQFGWESDVEQATLLLNWVDERILQRGNQQGTSPVADVIEDPGLQLDFVYRRDFTFRDQEFTLGLSARNILNEDNQEFQLNGGNVGRTEFNTYDRGTSLSASLTAKF